jgi:penicillin-binding protein 2
VADYGFDFMRLVLLRIFLIGSFLLLLANLFRAQVFLGEYYRGLADNNRIKEVPIHAPRGIIFDRNDSALVANLPAFRLDNKTISKDQAIALETQGKIAEVDSVRSYLYGQAFAHVLSGVEQFYNQKIQGVDGKELVEVDALGNKLRTISILPPTAGQNLTLTLDKDLQREAFTQMQGKKGAVVMTNPKTGEILALVSSPSFDPEKVSDYLEAPDQPLFDRAISGTYPSGSTFKIITATAGLETGKITESTTIDDPGVLVIGPYKFPNWKWLRDGGTQGTLNVVGALQKSNDIFFYRTGEWTGFDNLTLWAHKFGLGKKLGVDLPGESAGNWPQGVPYLGDLYHLAIGQGDLLVTPLQVNNWTSVIANGGKLCTPHVSGPADCKDIGISQNTLRLVKNGLIAACTTGGTAWPLFGMDVACKTGTAEYGDSQNRTHAWLTAFAPVETPQIAVTVLVEGGGEGSDVAAPIVTKILEKYFSP